jgi:hypothetical protein
MLAAPLAPPSGAEADPILLDAFVLDEPCSATGVVDLILKRPGELNKRVRDPGLSGELVPRFLAISLGGFTLFGVAMSVAMTTAGVWPELHAIATCLNDPSLRPLNFGADAATHPMLQRWLDGSAVRLILAYNLGLIAATGICLPSLYFYGLLSGIKMTMLDVVMQSLKSKATAAVALVGILPIYVAICLGVQLFQWAPAVRDLVLWLGLALPFIAGLWGTRSLYHGLQSLCDTLPACDREQRSCFLDRLVLAWAACYTAVTPLMIFALWEFFSRA